MAADRPNSRALSRLGPRGTFGLALLSVAERHQRVLGISADLAITAGMDRFRQIHAERFINVGIAEQNMVGIAAGLADDGWVPFAVSFANFSAMRSCEFVRHHLSYMRKNVKLVGIGAGFAMGQFGTTHYSLEDVSVLRAMPNLTILSPADCDEVFDAVCAAAEFDGPVYLRLSGAPSMPIVPSAETAFKIGKGRKLQEGSDVGIIASGSMVAKAMEAAKTLEASGVSVGVLNVHTIKPLDVEAICNFVGMKRFLFTIEEHSVIGGLGSAVSEVISEQLTGVRLKRIGIRDQFPKVGAYEWVLQQNGLCAEGIVKEVESALARL